MHATAQRLIEEYLAAAKHGGELDGSLFRPVKNNRTGTLDKHLDPGSVYRNIVRKYGRETGINAEANGSNGSRMLRPGAGREWPDCSKPAFRKA